MKNYYSSQPQHDKRMHKYRFGFILSTIIGNKSHYLNLRKFVERDPEVDSWWTQVDHLTTPAADRYLKFVPRPVAMRAWVLYQAFPGLRRLPATDAVMLHQFESEIICALRSYVRSEPLIVSSTDEAPIVDSASYPVYPGQSSRSAARRRFRLSLDKWRAKRLDCLIPFSKWAADLYRRSGAVSDEKIVPIHVGLDLAYWKRPDTASKPQDTKPKILFVGGDFERKGGSMLLDVFSRAFVDRADLHLVTWGAPSELPPNVHVHCDIVPNDSRLVALYGECDVLVVPTTADLFPWVFIEAMAMSCPVIGTDVGAISEIIEDGVTGFVIPSGDDAALAAKIKLLIDNPEIAQEMGRQGRLRVEREFNAERNVAKILSVMKGMVDRRRASKATRIMPGR